MEFDRNAKRPVLAFALGLALLPACSSAAPSRRASTAGSGEHVALRFAWPEGLSASVESEYRRSSTGGSGDAERSATGRYRLAVSRDTDGLLRIAAEEPHILSMNDRAVGVGMVATQPELLASFQVVGLFPPTLHVGPDAEIRSFEGLEGAAEQLRERIEQGLQDPRARELLRKAMQARLSPEASAEVAQEVWRLSVAMWEGAELELGEVYEVVQESTTVTFAAVQRAPCPAPTRSDDCVQLEASFTLDPEVLIEQYRGEAESLLDAADVELGADVIREASDVTEVEVLTEMATLLPYQVRIFDRREALLRDGQRIERTTEKTYRYRYRYAER